MKLVQTAALLLCLVLVACVAVRHDDAQGSAHYIASVSPNAADYPQPTAATGVAAAGTPAVASGPSGSFAPPPPPPPPPSTATGGGVVPTVPVTGSAGMLAAVGGSGVAHATAGAGTSTGMAGSGATAMAGAGATTGGDHAGTLMISFKTVTQNGQYAPQNVGAVWIETSSGMFVKTVERWAGIRASLLSRWNMASGGWGSLFGGGNKADMMDAVSKATARGYGAHTDTWDMKDASGKIVPDGKYQVVIEVTEDDFRPGASGVVPFEKGAMPVMANAPDMVPWSGLTLTYQP